MKRRKCDKCGKITSLYSLMFIAIWTAKGNILELKICNSCASTIIANLWRDNKSEFKTKEKK